MSAHLLGPFTEQLKEDTAKFITEMGDKIHPECKGDGSVQFYLAMAL